jgi:hypothetical protein
VTEEQKMRGGRSRSMAVVFHFMSFANEMKNLPGQKSKQATPDSKSGVLWWCGVGWCVGFVAQTKTNPHHHEEGDSREISLVNHWPRTNKRGEAAPSSGGTSGGFLGEEGGCD